jgi:hypothetical protein
MIYGIVAILPHCHPKCRTFFCVVAHNVEKYSTRCLQLPSFFRILGDNAENCSNFSSCVFFRVVAHNVYNFSNKFYISAICVAKPRNIVVFALTCVSGILALFYGDFGMKGGDKALNVKCFVTSLLQFLLCL